LQGQDSRIRRESLDYLIVFDEAQLRSKELAQLVK
jgi:hypothetical protein